MEAEVPGGELRPTLPTSFWAMEGQARESIGQSYDEGVMQINPNFGKVVIDAKGKRFKVNESLDEIKERWLKERTVIVVFQDESRNLTRGVKEDLIRAYEDGWMARRLFNPEVRRGRITFEGANVISYVAKAPEVAAWMVRIAATNLNLRGADYPVTFKSWMTKSDLKELRLKEAETNFWIVALRVPLEAFYYLPSAVEGLIGGVKNMHPPEADRTRPKLMNVKFDMDPQARFRVDHTLAVESPKREIWKMDVATPCIDWCRRCRWYFHTKDICPRSSQGERTARQWTNSRLPRQNRPPSRQEGLTGHGNHSQGQEGRQAQPEGEQRGVERRQQEAGQIRAPRAALRGLTGSGKGSQSVPAEYRA
ncbi:hypothetical protein CBR_g37847 [Chara braunii]|uniref:DUF4283 domain-containing protein n=1 Tax=Chara braunii TaxID=69332 RepID=A0A388LP21_CHABU|nr:hypothetical protein CBR_g37847 [Chara braunii]|eukprot:GBG83975.1 hypothetical protein CBR_g37847 [Chara braunii]